MSNRDPLFDFEAADEAYMLEIRPSSWLLSLPRNQQVRKLKHHIRLLERKQADVADRAEAARMAQIISAAKRYLSTIDGH